MIEKWVDNCYEARDCASEALKREYLFSVGGVDECDVRSDAFVFPIYYTPWIATIKIPTNLTISIGKKYNVVAMPSSKAFKAIEDRYIIPALSSSFHGESEKIADPINIHLKLSNAIESIVESRLGPPVIYRVEQMKKINNAVKEVRNFLDAVFSNNDLSSKVFLYDRRMLNMLIRTYKNYKKLKKVDLTHIDFWIGIYYTMLKKIYPLDEFADLGISVPNEFNSAPEPSEVPISEIEFLNPDIEFFISGRARGNISEKIFAQILGIAIYLYIIE